MKKRLYWIILAIAALIFCRPAFAQQPNYKLLKGCGFDRVKNKLKHEPFAPHNGAAFKPADSGQKVTVRVIFHVIYKTDSQNISIENIKREISDLNRDFQLLNTDTSDVYAPYKKLIGNPNISFVLADTSFNGSPDKGVKRVYARPRGNLWERDAVISPDRYLNVYSGEIGSDGYTFTDPWDAPQTDAIYLFYKWIGGSYRLLSHETGHWLGLYHIFEGGCSVENDGIADTPPQNGATGLGRGCDPNTIRNQCDDSPIPMFNNYMDYSDCRVMFTKEQAAMLRSDLFTYRPLAFTKGH